MICAHKHAAELLKKATPLQQIGMAVGSKGWIVIKTWCNDCGEGL